MTAGGIAATIALGVWMFYGVRDLLRHDWGAFLALRLVVGISMLVAATAGVVFLLRDMELLGLLALAIAGLISLVGGRAVIQALQTPSPQPIPPQPLPISELAFKALAAGVLFVVAAIELVK